jgi:hypothetical protein
MSLTRLASRLPMLVFAVCFCLSWGSAAWLRAQAIETDQSPDSAKASGATKMNEINTRKVKITADESKSNQLPAVEISLDLGQTGLSGRKFGNKGEYLRLSGPPGGPLGLIISQVADLMTDPEEWHDLIKDRYAEGPPTLGTVGEIKLAGEKRPAFTFTTGSDAARAHHLLVLVAIPDSQQGLLVDFYRRAGKSETPSPQELAKDEKFAELSPSFSIRFE